jgi:hypothetical protein
MSETGYIKRRLGWYGFLLAAGAVLVKSAELGGVKKHPHPEHAQVTLTKVGSRWHGSCTANGLDFTASAWTKAGVVAKLHRKVWP